MAAAPSSSSTTSATVAGAADGLQGLDTVVNAAGVCLLGKLEDVSTEGITSIEPIDIEFAREFGYRIKLLAISVNHGDHVEARVHPTMVPDRHMLANIGGAYNGIHFTGDMVGNVLLYGYGAGKMPTGSAT